MDKAYLESNSSQQPALELLQSLGYTYIAPEDCALQRGSQYHVLLKDILRRQLRRLNRYRYGGAENEFSVANIELAMEALDEPLSDGLVRTSEKIYDHLLLGQSFSETVGDGRLLSFNLKYIDWEHLENNVFHVTQEFAVESRDKQHNARPDIVLFVNGIPFAVIECKSPVIDVDQAVEQTIRNQQNDFIPQLYKFAQIVMATNKNAVKYATTGTPKKFWQLWKEEELDGITEQDKVIRALLSPARLLELTRYFIIYDANIKKICRYQQYFAIKAIIQTIQQTDERGNRQSGVIWHTQGSGKSLTMVMLAKYLLMAKVPFGLPLSVAYGDISPSPTERGRKCKIEFKTSDRKMWLELKERARNNRKEPTEAESVLWNAIRNKKLGVTFRRQHPIHFYIADFVCLERMLIIEVDGGYHFEDNQQYLDEIRTHDLNELGYRVIRFTNNEVMNHLSNVLLQIKKVLQVPLSIGEGDLGGEAHHPKVVIVTDRKELDIQIAKTFSHTRLHPARATSGRHLFDLVKSDKADVVTTIINKFNTAERLDSKNLSKDVFILVDESHRSNYGQMATKMRTVFPNACYIGFTGTPLMKKEKNTMTKFGGLIHKYTIQDGVNDGAIVPLIYEGRFVDQRVDEGNIDLWFEQTTKRLTKSQKQDLAKKWSSIRRLTSTDARIKRIALDINKHFVESIKNTGFKAMLATNYKRDAIRYLKCFEMFGDLECAVMISPPDMREGVDDIDEGTDEMVVAYWNKMMKQYGDAEKYEETLKAKFCDGELDIIIVCSKLLTGFDAPICQVLYIDKELKEHGLLQAIARTNRLADGKDYGLIIDYRGLIKKLDDALEVYSGAGLENFDSGDLKGVVVDIMTAIGKLRDAYSNLIQLFGTLWNEANSPSPLERGPGGEATEAIEVFLADDKRRESFYHLLSMYGRSLNIVLNSDQVYNELPKKEIKHYQDVFIYFCKVRRSVKLRYCDAIDNREYEKQMQNLLDTHLSVMGLKQITNPIDIMNRDEFEKELNELGSLRSKADAIRTRLNKSISEKYDENPAFYESFSKRILAALNEYKDRVITEAEYLNKMRDIMQDFRARKSTVTYPKRIKNDVHAQAFYGVISAILSQVSLAFGEGDLGGDAKQVPLAFGENESTQSSSAVCTARLREDFLAEIAVDITQIIAKHSQVDWTNNKTIHDRISQDIDDLFYRYECDRGIHIEYDTVDKIIENIKTVALRRF